jgi:broad specificity phosphatase PhoE
VEFPYLRAVQTAEIAVQGGGVPLPMRIDERLRDRELGILDLLTSRGVQNLFPAEAQRRAWLGQFYYRPPGGNPGRTWRCGCGPCCSTWNGRRFHRGCWWSATTR